MSHAAFSKHTNEFSPLSSLKRNNYKMSFSSSFGIKLATFLHTIRHLQIMALLALPTFQCAQNSQLEQLGSVYRMVQFSVFQIPTGIASNETQPKIRLGLCGLFLALQILSLVLMLVPVSMQPAKKILNIFSKIITVVAIITPIPISSLFSRNVLDLWNSRNVAGSNQILGNITFVLSGITLLLLVFTQFFYVVFHYQFSIKNSSQNCLARFPKAISKDFVWILIGIIQPFARHYVYPNFFISYQLLVLVLGTIEVRHYAVEIDYINSRMNRNLGLLSQLTITVCLANLSYLFELSLIRNSLIVFMLFFYLFFVKFFITFCNFWLKRIVIDDETTTEATQITYVTSYINFFREVSNKKYQTYISSLLKNHCNNCVQLDCCCKNRSKNYDPATSMHGNGMVQPHLDSVFIKHYLLNMIYSSIEEFPKSRNLKLLLSLYYLQFLQLPSECVKSIKFFAKKSQKDEAPLASRYAMFCLQQQFYELIYRKNLTDAEQKVEKAKEFDENFGILNQKINDINQNLALFWYVLSSTYSQENSKMDQNFLKILCSATLKLMFQIQGIYSTMKATNSVSSRFRELMFLYTKQILHDAHFLQEIKDSIKLQLVSKRLHHRNQELKTKIFSKNTAILVVTDESCIKWASTNSAQIFGYQNKYQMYKLKVNNLMPEYFARTHDDKIRQWAQTGKCRKMNKCVNVWACMQNGACFRATLYIKILPHLLQRDIQYYTSVQVTGRNQIICGPTGQIYGCDQVFGNLLQAQLKSIQNTRLNIQILFPLSFQQFFTYFFGEKTQNLKKIEVKYSGYLPIKIEDYLSTFKKQRELFYGKNAKQRNFNEALAWFLETMMQQSTTDLNGCYLTIDFEIQKILLLEINRQQTNTVENYYDQLQKAISLIQDNFVRVKQIKSHSCIKKIAARNYTINNPFQMFLNPKKLKRMIKNEQKIDLESKKDRKLSITRRKQRAINRLVTINNQNVRENILKMKRVLYNEGVFSAYTYNVLTQKQTPLQQIEAEAQDNSEKGRIESSKKTTASRKKAHLCNSSLKNYSDSDEGSREQLLEDEQNCSDTHKGERASFQQSATSSAALISLSTKVKNLKLRLRQVNTPKFLIIINTGLLVLLLTSNLAHCGNLYHERMLDATRKTNVQKDLETDLIIIGLLDSRSLQIQTERERANGGPILREFRDYFLQQVMKQVQSYMDRITKIYAADLETYFQIPIQTTTSSSLQGFIYKQYQQLLRQDVEICPRQYSETIQSIKSLRKTPFLSEIKLSNSIVSYLEGTFMIILLTGTLVVAFRASLKINKIVQLLSRIYPHERKYYLAHFTRMQKVIQNMINEQAPERCEIETKQRRHKYTSVGENAKNITSYKYMNQNTLKEQLLSINNINFKTATPKNENGSNLQGTQQQNKLNISALTDESKHRLYFKIVAIFLALILMVGSLFLVNYTKIESMKSLQDRFHNMVDGKIRLNYLLYLLQSQYYLSSLTADSSASSHELRSIYNETKQFFHKYNQELPAPTTLIIKNLLAIYNDDSNKDKTGTEKQTYARLRDHVEAYMTQNLCPQIAQVNSFGSELQTLCRNISSGTFSKGVMNSYYYIEQSIKYYSQQPRATGQGNSMTQLVLTNAINSLLIGKFIHKLTDVRLEFSKILFELHLITAGAFLLVSAFGVVVWRRVYRQIAASASYYNLLLLLIPFEVLIENPYIKLYLKKQFGFKSIIY